MSLNPNKVKQSVLKGINKNPSIVTLKRISKVEIDGAFEEAETETAMKVLIYKNKSNSARVDSNTIGTSNISVNYSMICSYDANLTSNPREYKTFNCLEGNMKIVSVSPIVVKETVCGYEVDLQKVD